MKLSHRDVELGQYVPPPSSSSPSSSSPHYSISIVSVLIAVIGEVATAAATCLSAAPETEAVRSANMSKFAYDNLKLSQ